MTDLDVGSIERLVDRHAEEHHCPTIAWGVVRDGRLAAAGSVGDVTERTVYRIASMTKSFSAAAVLALRDDGVLRLDDPIELHAPELATLRHPAADVAPITIRDLLTMSSGLPTDDPWADRHLDLTDGEFDRIVADGPLFAAPTGERFEYSNFGFAVLGRVVLRASGQRIQDVISERLIEPLGLTRTTWVQPGHDDWVRPMRWEDGTHVEELAPLGDGVIAPMGGLWTTIEDLATWVGFLDDAFPARDDPDDGPLRRASRREMQQPHRYAGRRTVRGLEAPAAYGYGLVTVDEPGRGTAVFHSGGLPGYGSNMRWLRGRRTGVIALANVTYAPMVDLCARMLDALMEQGAVGPSTAPEAPWLHRLGADLVALLNHWDDDHARRLFTTSLVLDDSLERRRHGAARLIDAVGALTIESIDAVTETRGSVRATGAEGGDVEITVLLAPPAPPRIQSYEATLVRDT